MGIKLGQKVRDTLTGLEGVAISRTEFLYGCVRVGVQPFEVKDGKPVDATWIDEPQLEVVRPAAAVKPPKSPPAGPRPDAHRAPDAQ